MATQYYLPAPSHSDPACVLTPSPLPGVSHLPDQLLPPTAADADRATLLIRGLFTPDSSPARSGHPDLFADRGEGGQPSRLPMAAIAAFLAAGVRVSPDELAAAARLGLGAVGSDRPGTPQWAARQRALARAFRGTGCLPSLAALIDAKTVERRLVRHRLRGLVPGHFALWCQVGAVPPPTPPPIGDANANHMTTAGHALPLGLRDDWQCPSCTQINWRVRTACIKCYPWEPLNLEYLLGLGPKASPVRLSFEIQAELLAALNALNSAALLTYDCGIKQMLLLDRSIRREPDCVPGWGGWGGAGGRHDPLATAVSAQPGELLYPLLSCGWDVDQLRVVAHVVFGWPAEA